MLYQAHRGVCTEYPENTMPAFQAAVQQGYHIIELDPSFTADNQCVIHHDPTINRTCRTQFGENLDEQVPVTQVTYEQLMQYDAGLWKDTSFRGTKVPLLREVLSLAKETGIALKIDNIFAAFSDEQQEILFHEVKRSGANVGFTCPSIESVRKVVAQFPAAEIHYDGVVNEENVRAVFAELKDNPYTVWLPLDCSGTSWSKLPKANKTLCEMVKKYARLGIWLLKTQEELEQASSLGADVIETDGSLKPVPDFAF